VIPLALCIIGGVLLWTLFIDRIVRSTAEDALGDLLGTEVDIAAVDVQLRHAAIAISGFAVAEPSDSMRNVVDVGDIALDLDASALLRKKLVVERASIRDVRFNTGRSRPARPAKPGGYAVTALGSLRAWAKQVAVPPLRLLPIDTIKSVVLDPSQLASVQAAAALAKHVDSLRAWSQTGYDSLRLTPALDTAQALARRLAGTRPSTLGIDGTRRAIADIQKSVGQLTDAKKRIDGYAQRLETGFAALQDEVRGLDAAKQKDYDFARGLLKIPSLRGPEIGAALFGPVSIDRVQRLLYWYSLADHYLPPGLKPEAQPGPTRKRLAGTTVRFPVVHGYPLFWLKQGDVGATVGGSAAGTYKASIANFSTAPELVGAPTRFQAQRRPASAEGVSVDAAGMMNRVGGPPRDSLNAVVQGVSLPAFALPGLPLRLNPGAARVDVRFARTGDQMQLRLAAVADHVSWPRDTTRTSSALEAAVVAAIARVPSVSITTTLEGSIASPRVSINSNVDDAVAAALKNMAGDAIASAQARARAQVDRLTADKLAAARARVDSVQAAGRQRLAEAQGRLADARKQLEDQLKALTSPLGGLKIPRP
jgi:uncharacterized protein (TIGR03545 family)